MKVLTKVGWRGRGGGVLQSANSRGTQTLLLMTQFLQREGTRLQHFPTQRWRLTSILPILRGVVGKEEMRFANRSRVAREEEFSGATSFWR